MRQKVYLKGKIEVNESYEAETIETTIAKLMGSGEGIDDTVQQMFTERKDGVLPETDIRTDRFDIAIEAMSKVEKSYKAQRAEKMNKVDKVEPTNND